jgi:uncharacterized membrane protein
MAVCAKCGASLSESTAFCASCGTQVMRAAPQPQATRGGPSPLAGWPVREGSIPSNVAGALAYLLGLITGIIFLRMEPYNRNPFVRFHAFQSIFLFIFYMMLFMAWNALVGILFAAGVSSAWSVIFYFRYYVLRVALGALQLFVIYKALRGDRFSLPIIGPLAAKQAG